MPTEQMELVYRGSTAWGYRGGNPIFKVEYYGSPPGIPIKDEGWRLYEMRWHKTRFGKPVKNKYAREALVGVFETQEQALDSARVRYSK